MQEFPKRKFALSVAVLLVGGMTVLTADYLIKTYFPNRLILEDLMFRVLPYWPGLSTIADGLVVMGMLLIGVFSRGKISRLSMVFFSFGFMMLCRGLLNLVTPLGDPSGDVEVYGFLERYPLVGMFPSGHTTSLVLEYLLIKDWAIGKRWELLFIVLILLEIFTLLATHGHYSIDIVGGVILGYFAVKAAKRYA